MNIKLIKAELDYSLALQKLDKLFYAKPDPKEGEERAVLSFLIDPYKGQHFPIHTPDSIEAVKFKTAQWGLQKT